MKEMNQRTLGECWSEFRGENLVGKAGERLKWAMD